MAPTQAQLDQLHGLISVSNNPDVILTTINTAVGTLPADSVGAETQKTLDYLNGNPIDIQQGGNTSPKTIPNHLRDAILTRLSDDKDFFDKSLNGSTSGFSVQDLAELSLNQEMALSQILTNSTGSLDPADLPDLVRARVRDNITHDLEDLDGFTGDALYDAIKANAAFSNLKDNGFFDRFETPEGAELKGSFIAAAEASLGNANGPHFLKGLAEAGEASPSSVEKMFYKPTDGVFVKGIGPHTLNAMTVDPDFNVTDFLDVLPDLDFEGKTIGEIMQELQTLNIDPAQGAKVAAFISAFYEDNKHLPKETINAIENTWTNAFDQVLPHMQPGTLLHGLFASLRMALPALFEGGETIFNLFAGLLGQVGIAYDTVHNGTGLSAQPAFAQSGGYSGIGAVAPGQLNPDLATRMATDPDVRRYAEHAIQQAEAAGLDGNMFANQLWQESRFNPNAVSPRGALGIGQFMPDTGRNYGLSGNDFFDPIKSIDASVRHMSDLAGRYGSQEMALVAYNGGPDAIQGHADINSWMNAMHQERLARPGGRPGLWRNETFNYIRKITGYTVGQPYGPAANTQLVQNGANVGAQQVSAQVTPGITNTTTAVFNQANAGVTPESIQTAALQTLADEAAATSSLLNASFSDAMDPATSETDAAVHTQRRTVTAQPVFT